MRILREMPMSIGLTQIFNGERRLLRCGGITATLSYRIIHLALKNMHL
jgi:hypothetical protein